MLRENPPRTRVQYECMIDDQLSRYRFIRQKQVEVERLAISDTQYRLGREGLTTEKESPIEVKARPVSAILHETSAVLNHPVFHQLPTNVVDEIICRMLRTPNDSTPASEKPGTTLTIEVGRQEASAHEMCEQSTTSWAAALDKRLRAPRSVAQVLGYDSFPVWIAPGFWGWFNACASDELREHIVESIGGKAASVHMSSSHINTQTLQQGLPKLTPDNCPAQPGVWLVLAGAKDGDDAALGLEWSSDIHGSLSRLKSAQRGEVIDYGGVVAGIRSWDGIHERCVSHSNWTINYRLLSLAKSNFIFNKSTATLLMSTLSDLAPPDNSLNTAGESIDSTILSALRDAFYGSVDEPPVVGEWIGLNTFTPFSELGFTDDVSRLTRYLSYKRQFSA